MAVDGRVGAGAVHCCAHSRVYSSCRATRWWLLRGSCFLHIVRGGFADRLLVLGRWLFWFMAGFAGGQSMPQVRDHCCRTCAADWVGRGRFGYLLMYWAQIGGRGRGVGVDCGTWERTNSLLLATVVCPGRLWLTRDESYL